jgi:hypothetical protein
MLRLCSDSLHLYPGRPHRHAILCHCQKTSKALVDQALAHGSLLFIHASEQQQQCSEQSVARVAAMQCVTDEESAEAILAERLS